MSINIRLLSYVLLLSSSVAAQTVLPPPAVGDLTVTIKTAPAATGSVIAIFSGAAAAACTASTTPLALAPNTGKTVLGGQPSTAVTLATPLTAADTFLCATLTDPAATKVLKVPAVSVGPAAPLPASTKPVVAPGQGTPLPVLSTVNQSIRIDAVLIPPVIAQRIFGKEVSQNYAAVQITIANHNQNASFVLESTAMDYSHWLFSNNFQLPGSECPANNVTSASFNTCNQIASVESRAVRSEMEDAQVWSARNKFIRIASLAGTIATSYIFLAQNTDYTTGVANYTGQVVPALNAFYPDRSQAQINNISDMGFKTPHVIPKASSDIIVAFFPLADFLTPKLRELYLKSPATFNVPGEMLIDAKLTKRLAQMMESAGVLNTTQLDSKTGKAKEEAEVGQVSTALGHYEHYAALLKSGAASSAADPSKPAVGTPVQSPADKDAAAAKAANLTDDDRLILSILQKASINNINILVDGIMTVDVNAVPAIIKDPVVITDETKTATWAKGTTVKGTINGSFLTGGTVSLAKPVTGMPTDFTVDTKTSTDSTLYFSFTLTDNIPQGTELDFVVNKKASDGSSTASPPSKYVVPKASDEAPAVASAAAPTVTNVAVDNDTKAATWGKGATVTGKLTGTGLTGGTIALATAVNGIPATITVDPAKSSATVLAFSFKLTGNIDNGTKITFVVTTKATDGTTTVTTAPEYTVPAFKPS